MNNMAQPTASIFVIPPHFLTIRYNGAHYPGSPNTNGLEGGANCQQFAYELLRHNSFSVPDLRSRELWEDTTHTYRVTELTWGDLLLWNKTPDPYGAHVGVYIGDGQAIHLAKDNGYPVMERLENIAQHPAYRVFIGAKRAMLHGGN
ncbi:MAG: NlpC/P60 family protein [Candidatus Thiothrix putei]|uniref:NlpC/P60 family protein n=1 Tax=Candidatus Thiothrix putei TaxID=3080811 RepID=A0AA95KJE7_9GAMM|nr:MAG: NlpC/P60 family protein [Candidatus Thiothrix putei]